MRLMLHCSETSDQQDWIFFSPPILLSSTLPSPKPPPLSTSLDNKLIENNVCTMINYGQNILDEN